MVKYIFIIGSLFLISCFKDDELSIIRKENTSSKLKLTGYFYNEFLENPNKIQIYFLYKNGVILYGLAQDKTRMLDFEEQYRKGEFYKEYANNKDIWGVYEVIDNVIKFERWYPSDRPYQTAIREGEILNDTTFRITTLSEPDGSCKEERDEVYRFKKFSPKPDSTNMFVK